MLNISISSLPADDLAPLGTVMSEFGSSTYKGQAKWVIFYWIEAKGLRTICPSSLRIDNLLKIVCWYEYLLNVFFFFQDGAVNLPIPQSLRSSLNMKTW